MEKNMHDLSHPKFTIYLVSRMSTTMKDAEVLYCDTWMGVQYQKITFDSTEYQCEFYGLRLFIWFQNK